MQLVVAVARGISVISFAWYGATLLSSQAMAVDFARYGLGRYRVLVGTLQLAGSLGLVIGSWFPPLVVLSAGGLALMMLVAVAARLRVGDRVVAMLPALAFGVLNLYIAVTALPVPF